MSGYPVAGIGQIQVTNAVFLCTTPGHRETRACLQTQSAGAIGHIRVVCCREFTLTLTLSLKGEGILRVVFRLFCSLQTRPKLKPKWNAQFPLPEGEGVPGVALLHRQINISILNVCWYCQCAIQLLPVIPATPRHSGESRNPEALADMDFRILDGWIPPGLDPGSRRNDG